MHTTHVPDAERIVNEDLVETLLVAASPLEHLTQSPDGLALAQKLFLLVPAH